MASVCYSVLYSKCSNLIVFVGDCCRCALLAFVRLALSTQRMAAEAALLATQSVATTLLLLPLDILLPLVSLRRFCAVADRLRRCCEVDVAAGAVRTMGFGILMLSLLLLLWLLLLVSMLLLLLVRLKLVVALLPLVADAAAQ